MHVVVMGSGLLGTASAWYLAKAGHRVTVVDRQPGAALETSFANGGQISVNHAEPWASPSAPLKVLKWLSQEDAPLLFRLRADPAQWAWGLKFLLECFPSRARKNTATILNLGLYSRAALQALRAETGIQYDHLTRGILHFYMDAKEFEGSLEAAQLIRDLGGDREVLNPRQCVEVEPALVHAEGQLVGGTYTATDETGNAQKFTVALAKLCTEQGVEFAFETSIEHIRTAGDRIESIRARDARGETRDIAADAFVVALGSYSAAMLRPLGVSMPVYPAKGYSITVPIVRSDEAPFVSLTDNEYKIVFTRLGNELRVAGTAELNGYNTELNLVRCEALVKRARALFPNACDYSQPKMWTGLRPATPSNVPVIGRSRYANLYLNTGHGTLGWTHACGSGKAIAEIIDGHVPEVHFPFVGMPRADRTMTVESRSTASS